MTFLGCNTGFALVLLITAVPQVSAAGLVDGARACFFMHLDVSALLSDPTVEVQTPAGRVPAAKVLLPVAIIPSVALGYRLDAPRPASTTVGYPPIVDIGDKGALSKPGGLDSTTPLPRTAYVRYHFTILGAVRPCLGGGPAYMLVAASHEASISRLRVRSARGAFLQGGVDQLPANRTGVLVDIERALLDTASGARLGRMPILAKARLNPPMIPGGMTYRV